MFRSTALAALALVSSLPAQEAGDWSQFRGPGGLSVADDTPIPEAFGPAKNVLWKTSVPAGHSSPCIVG
jgi:outer membrane protein assembly factor BamB